MKYIRFYSQDIPCNFHDLVVVFIYMREHRGVLLLTDAHTNTHTFTACNFTACMHSFNISILGIPVVFSLEISRHKTNLILPNPFANPIGPSKLLCVNYGVLILTTIPLFTRLSRIIWAKQNCFLLTPWQGHTNKMAGEGDVYSEQ